MKYTGTVVKTLSLLLVIGSLIFYQNIAQSRAEHNAAVRAQIKAEEKKLDLAYRKFSVWRSIKNTFDDNLKRIKTGAWAYFEHGNVIDKICKTQVCTDHSNCDN